MDSNNNKEILLTNIIKKDKIYEGKAKILYRTNYNSILIQYFKDDATAFNGEKKANLAGKGRLNSLISSYIMQELANNSIENHFIKQINDNEQLIKSAKIIPLEVIIRNIVAGSVAKKLKITEGKELKSPTFEICYKNDELGDPLINDDYAVNILEIVSATQLQHIKNQALNINKILKIIFNKANLKLIDFKIEFGFDENNNIILADEISPDCCRLWDATNDQKMDKDVFRRDLGNLVETYQNVATRLGL